MYKPIVHVISLSTSAFVLNIVFMGRSRERRDENSLLKSRDATSAEQNNQRQSD